MHKKIVCCCGKSNRIRFFYAGNEPKSVLARDLGDCRDNLRNSQSVFLIVEISLSITNTVL